MPSLCRCSPIGWLQSYDLNCILVNKQTHKYFLDTEPEGAAQIPTSKLLQLPQRRNVISKAI